MNFDRQKSAFNNIISILKMAWHHNNKLIILSVAQIPIIVILPYAKALLPSIIIKGINKNLSLFEFILPVIICSVILLICTTSIDYLGSKITWLIKTFSMTLLSAVDEVTLDSEYEDIEGEIGQSNRNKAINATYKIGMNIIPLISSIFTNILGFLVFSITLSFFNIYLFAIIIIVSIASYAVREYFNKYEIMLKDKISAIEKK